MKYLFYFKNSSEIECCDIELNAGYSYYFWRPGVGRVKPQGVQGYSYVVWWIFHFLRIFYNGDYSMFLIRVQDKIVHHSAIFPGYFRFPFMLNADLQIGNIWTHPMERGKGLATFAVQKIAESFKEEDRTLWFITEESNKASLKVIEKARFTHRGYGIRTKKFGLKAFGSYLITN